MRKGLVSATVIEKLLRFPLTAAFVVLYLKIALCIFDVPHLMCAPQSTVPLSLSDWIHVSKKRLTIQESTYANIPSELHSGSA